MVVWVESALFYRLIAKTARHHDEICPICRLVADPWIRQRDKANQSALAGRTPCFNSSTDATVFSVPS